MIEQVRGGKPRNFSKCLSLAGLPHRFSSWKKHSARQEILWLKLHSWDSLIKKNQYVRSISLKQVHHTLKWSIGNVFQLLPSLPTLVIARISYWRAIGCFEGWIDPLACGATRLGHNRNAASSRDRAEIKQEVSHYSTRLTLEKPAVASVCGQGRRKRKKNGRSRKRMGPRRGGSRNWEKGKCWKT